MKLQYEELAQLLALEEAEAASVDPATIERIQVRTMKKLNQNQNEGKRQIVTRSTGKKLRFMPAVAAVTALAVVGGAAAYAINQQSFQEFFRNGSTRGQTETVELNQSQSAALEEMTVRTIAPCTANGTTVTPVEALCDGYVLYLMLQVEAPEGTVLPDLSEEEGYYTFRMQVGEDRFETESFSEDFTNNFLPQETIAAVYISGVSVMPDENPTDNVKTFVLSYEGTGIETEGNILTLPGLSIQRPSGEIETLLEGVWKFDLSDCEKCQNLTPDVKGMEIVYPDSQEGEDKLACTIYSLRVSALSLCLNLVLGQDAYMVPSVSLVFADDTQVELIQRACTQTQLNFSFSAPIDLNQLESVVVGDAVIHVR